MRIILMIVEAAVLACCCAGGGWRLLHYFQLESYQLPGFFRSIRRNAQKALLPGLSVAAAGVLGTVLGCRL